MLEVEVVMLIHFVCTGNVYRSRLAEAYLNSKAIPGLQATSSGTLASLNQHGPITWYAARLIERHGLVPFMSQTWRQSDLKTLSAADCIVFMEDEHLAHCRAAYGFADLPYRVWCVRDVDAAGFSDERDACHRELLLVQATERTFDRIRTLVDELIEELAASAQSNRRSSSIVTPGRAAGWTLPPCSSDC